MRLIILSLFITTQTFAQWIAGEEIDGTTVQKWPSKSAFEYQGVYHFGDSENESDLILFFAGEKITGQIRSGSWSDDGVSWVWTYENLRNIKIDGNKFFSDKANGEFVMYGKGAEKIMGLKITEPWSGIPENGQWEIGPRTGDVNDFINGRFPQASLTQLDKNTLTTLNKSDLRIMRNEIFARYGLKFKPNGEMDNYFKKQPWYQGQHDNVDKFLTNTEKENIKIIQELENR